MMIIPVSRRYYLDYPLTRMLVIAHIVAVIHVSSYGPA